MKEIKIIRVRINNKNNANKTKKIFFISLVRQGLILVLRFYIRDRKPGLM